MFGFCRIGQSIRGPRWLATRSHAGLNRLQYTPILPLLLFMAYCLLINGSAGTTGLPAGRGGVWCSPGICLRCGYDSGSRAIDGTWPKFQSLTFWVLKCGFVIDRERN